MHTGRLSSPRASFLAATARSGEAAHLYVFRASVGVWGVWGLAKLVQALLRSPVPPAAGAACVGSVAPSLPPIHRPVVTHSRPRSCLPARHGTENGVLFLLNNGGDVKECLHNTLKYKD